MRQQYDAFRERGVALLAISSDDVRKGAALREELDIPFPLLADPQHKVIDSYEVFHENEPKGRSIARPAAFVISEEGVIRYCYVGENANDRPEVETMLAALSFQAAPE